MSFLILVSIGVAGCSAPLASLTVGFPSLMFFMRTMISLSRTSSLIMPPSSSSTGSSSPILMDRTIFSILLSEPSPSGMQSL